MDGSGCSNNVAIGNQAMRDPGVTAIVANNIVIGSNACLGPGVGSNVVCIGERAGYCKSSSLGTIGSHAIIIGSNTCDMGNTNNYVGDYSISLGTAFSEPVPSDSMMLGRGARAASANSGQIVIGSNLHYATMVCSVADHMAFQTGTAKPTQSLFLSPTTCNMTSSGSAKITCGSNVVELTPSKYILPSVPLIISGIYRL